MRCNRWFSTVAALMLSTTLLGNLAHAQLCEVFEDATLATHPEGFSSYPPAVAGDGDWAITGMPGMTGSDATPGRAFMMQRSGFSKEGKLLWTAPVEILPSTSMNGDNFGAAAAMWDDIAVVGAPGGTMPGAAYVFRNTEGVWIEEAKLVPAVGEGNDRFGMTVDIEGDYVVVGKRGQVPGVLIFKNTGERWELEDTLVPAMPNLQFGKSASISGDRVLCGTSDRGLVFQREGSEWTEQPPLLGAATAVALQGDMAILASPTDSGMALVYEFDGKVWTQTQIITASDLDPSLSPETDFGASVSLKSDLLVIGDPLRKPTSIWSFDSIRTGGVYLFKRLGNQWVQQERVLVGSKCRGVESLGVSVRISDDAILVAGREPKFWNAKLSTSYAFAFEPQDCNANGIPDRCDEPDCDTNAVIDVCELASGEMADCNGNGIPDACEAVAQYALDDGSAEVAWGISTFNITPKDWLWMNQFSVIPGAQSITHIEIAWNSLAWEGYPVKLAIFDDPNNDGHPGDATLIASFDTQTHAHGASYGDTPFSRVAIPATYVGEIGDSFFVGVLIEVDANGEFFNPAFCDTTLSQNRTFFYQGTLGETNLQFPSATMSLITLPTVIVNSNFMIRAVSFDCNGNGTWDQCDIDSGLIADVNGNGVPDECEGSCAADLAPEKGNNAVDVDDLLFIINNWGMCEIGEPCDGDVAPVGGNGQVDVDDLLFVINNWGPCL